MVLKLVYIAILLIWCIYPLESAWYRNLNENQNQTIARPGCNPRCGNVSILFPFGMHDPKCYASKAFEIECRHSNNTFQGDRKPVPYLKYINLEVMYIDVVDGTVGIKNPIFHPGKSCERTGTGKNLEGSPFVYSHNYNSFVAVGCQNAAFLVSSNNTILTACMSLCYDHDLKNGNDIDINSCHGTYCCETTLTPYLSAYNISVETVEVDSKIKPECAYVLIKANYKSFDYVYDEYNSSYWVPTLGNLKKVKDVPAVLEWEIPIHTPNNSFPEFRTDPYGHGSYICGYTNVASLHTGWRCSCTDGFQGNPYIQEGCKAMPSDKKKTLRRWVKIGLTSCLATTILLLSLRWLHKSVRKKITKKRKEKFFKGLLLEQRLSSTGEVNVDKIKLFSLKDLRKATDHFNINRVVGKGGQGTVYKGMLVDGKIVAVKKFKVNGKVEEFINEFVILSQINHRNVVQLLGCCLETEIPLLVYEFIPNGNLYEYLHGQNEELPMTWNMRLRIATEVAGALFYLHSFASQPIYHRDIKSTNILLDGKYKAKVADFGASRMVSIEATHLTTAVQGTFGYLDPEYFYTNQLTEKSDVYSFGVVLVELLTGQKPISTVREPEFQSLASQFLLCMEENLLFDIIDERVMQEGEKEHIIVVANLARRCLESNGRKRPTMKEVTLELESIQKSQKQSNAQEHHEELQLAGIEDNQFRVAYSSTSSSGQTLDSKESTMEIMPILIK